MRGQCDRARAGLVSTCNVVTPVCVDSVTGQELAWLVQCSNTSVCGQCDRARAGLVSTM